VSCTESAEDPIFKRLINPQYSYIDMGAWIGPTLLLGCQLAKHCHGIEPDLKSYAETCGKYGRQSASVMLAGRIDESLHDRILEIRVH
jgi:hypothetical protein